MDLVVSENGMAMAIYSEEIDLGTIGEATITRASHVEPENGAWWADMSPSGGPKLGPFERRSEALEAEVDWLKQNRLFNNS